MGIAPITNLIPLSQTRTIKSELEPMPMERVEDSARAGDETYTPHKGKSSRGSDDDAEDELEGMDEEAGGESASPETPGSEARPINFFA
jgi:hypothetical protein